MDLHKRCRKELKPLENDQKFRTGRMFLVCWWCMWTFVYKVFIFNYDIIYMKSLQTFAKIGLASVWAAVLSTSEHKGLDYGRLQNWHGQVSGLLLVAPGVLHLSLGWRDRSNTEKEIMIRMWGNVRYIQILGCCSKSGRLQWSPSFEMCLLGSCIRRWLVDTLSFQTIIWFASVHIFLGHGHGYLVYYLFVFDNAWQI